MARIPRSSRLLRKAEAALLSAIEIYNKPDFKYREECFAILVLNAWELLLKAKLLSDAGNDLKSLHVYQPRPTKGGAQSKRQYLRRTRSGNPYTKSLGQVVVALDVNPQSRLSNRVKANLDALQEIRDNAVHYFNASPQLAKQILEIGTASVMNFVELARRWFACDLSGYSLYLLPVGFISPQPVSTVFASVDETKILKFLATLVEGQGSSPDDDFHVALEVNLSLRKSPSGTPGAATISTGVDGLPVTVSEEDIRQRYPWDYKQLVARLANRYLDFKANSDFHTIRRPVLTDPRYVYTRFLDPGNVKSGKKAFYNPNIVVEFDKHYTKSP